MFEDLYVKLPSELSWRTAVTGTAFFAAGFLARGFFVQPRRGGIIESPRATLLPKLSKDEITKLPYPPDALPGARDIVSPFGTIRAYEFGPELGRKVLLVHGISTPCLALGGLAHILADNGCRVMLFDLPGRGYSDTPDDLHHDMRLLTSILLLVLASSPLSWTGGDSDGFSLIGYSLGGGIAASFTSFFASLVNSLILIAPAGLIRDHHISRTSRIIYSEGVIPEPILNRLVRRRLQKPLYPPKKSSNGATKAGAEQAVSAEINVEGNEGFVLSKKHPNITIEDAVNHQVQHHEGFVKAFMSSIRYGPIQNQHERWRQIGVNLDSQNNTRQTNSNKVFILLGQRDPIIVAEELQADANVLLEDNVSIKVFEAGHELPITQADKVAEAILTFWKTTEDD